MSLKEKLLNLFEEYAEDTAFELVDLTLQPEGGRLTLRIYIDQEGGVNLDDCAGVNRAFGNILDEIDPIDQDYVLEVSSPGVNRRLRKLSDFERFKGNQVKVKISESMFEEKKRLNYKGKLIGITEDNLVELELFDQQRVSIPHSLIVQANIIYQF